MEKQRYFVTVAFHEVKTDAFTSDVYNYWIDTEKQITKGDFLILKDDESTWDALKVVKVVYVESFVPGKTYENARTKGLIGFADVHDYFDAKERKRQAKEVKAKMEVRFKEAEKMNLYTKLAETDPEMASLLSEYKSLMGDEVEDVEDEEDYIF